jgi:TetR/AcrR family transcriptional regulator
VGTAKRERDAEVAREAILEAAEEVFAREGFDGARIDTIAAEAGYNKSLLFHYFGDKEGLYRAIIKKLKASMGSELMEPLTIFAQSSDEMSAERVRIFLELAIGRFFDFLIQHPRNLRMMAWEAAEGWHTFTGGVDKEVEAYRSSTFCIVDFLRRAQEADLLNREIDPRFMITSVMNICIIHLLSVPRFQWVFGESASEPQSTASMRRQIVQLVLHGILTSPQERTS